MDCDSSTKIKAISTFYLSKYFQDNTQQKFVPPCTEVKKMEVSFDEKDGEENKNAFNNEFYNQFKNAAGSDKDWFIVHLHFWSLVDFKEIKQVRAYTIESVVGNSSGYIGFLMGISVSQLPYAIFGVYSKLKSRLYIGS